MVKTVLRYAGGKAKAVDLILSQFPSNTENMHYIEPCVGGGSVFLASVGKFRSYWINDKYKDLINFWRFLASPKGYELEELLDPLLDYTIEEKKFIFNGYRNNYISIDEATAAARFFFLNRCSFSGTIEAGGFSANAAEKRFTKSSLKRCTELHKFLQEVRPGITTMDVLEIMDMTDENSFVFLDPPYYTAKALYGKKGELHKFDYTGLRDKLLAFKGKFLMTLDDCLQTREIYKDFNIKPFTLQYSMVGSDSKGKRKKGDEIFVTNY